MITEDNVKLAMKFHLVGLGYLDVQVRLGTAPGIDVEGIHPLSGCRLAIECKGETAAAGQWDRAWRNASAALFNAVKTTEDKSNVDKIALAFPDTQHYQGRMEGLQNFCRKQKIEVYWVAEDGRVHNW